jgi:hypothetical protein
MKPMLSPGISPSQAALWGALLAAPAAVFIAANLLNEAGIAFLYTWIDPLVGRTGIWQFIGLGSPLVLLGGIGAALLLNVLAIARLGVRQDDRRFTFTLTVEPRVPNLALLFGAGVMLAALLAYAAVENYAVIRTHV